MMNPYVTAALMALTLSTAPLCFAETPAAFRSQVLPRAAALKVDGLVEKPADAGG